MGVWDEQRQTASLQLGRLLQIEVLVGGRLT